MKIVFVLGGSVVVPDDVDTEYVSEFSKFASNLAKKHELAIVVGGGKTARRAIERIKEGGGNNVERDYAGIEASRSNASALIEALGMNQKIPETIGDAKKLLDANGIVVMGGTEPGHSTDAVAALLAEYIDADLLLKVTNVDGIYDKDPRKFKDAKLFKELAINDLDKMVIGLSQDAGKYELFDILAVKVLKRSGIKCIALNGSDLDNMDNAISKKDFKGTLIR